LANFQGLRRAWLIKTNQKILNIQEMGTEDIMWRMLNLNVQSFYSVEINERIMNSQSETERLRKRIEKAWIRGVP